MKMNNQHVLSVTLVNLMDDHILYHSLYVTDVALASNDSLCTIVSVHHQALTMQCHYLHLNYYTCYYYNYFHYLTGMALLWLVEFEDFYLSMGVCNIYVPSLTCVVWSPPIDTALVLALDNGLAVCRRDYNPKTVRNGRSV